MARGGTDDKLGPGPRPVQGPGLLDGADHVVAPVHDDPGDIAEPVGILEQLVLAQEGVVHEVVAFDAGQAQGRGLVREMRDHRSPGFEVGSTALPQRPGPCGLTPHRRVIRGEPPVVRTDHVRAFVLRDQLDVRLPQFGLDAPGAILVEPPDVPSSAQEDAAQDESRDPLGMGLRICKRERRTPGAAEHEPGADAEVAADSLDVPDQVRGGVLVQLRVRARAPAAALVEQDDAPVLWVEEAAVEGLTGRARAAVQEDDGHALGVATLLHPQGVDLGDPELEFPVRPGLRVEGQQFHRGLKSGGRVQSAIASSMHDRAKYSKAFEKRAAATRGKSLGKPGKPAFPAHANPTCIDVQFRDVTHGLHGEKMTNRPVCHALAIVLLLLFAAGVSGMEQAVPDTGRAQALFDSGKYDEALAILRPMAEAHPKDTGTLFLLGLSAIERARRLSGTPHQEVLLDEAVTALRTILVDRPELVRVRLELARAFFYKREDDLARDHFERVLAGKPPGPVIANIQHFLSQIRARRRWSMYVGGALAPSTNIGASSTERTINIYGLPFRRDADELKKSGVGLSLWAGGEYIHPLGQRTQLLLGSDAARQEYPGGEFDQMFLSVHAGPRWLVGRNTRVDLLADVRQRWIDSSPYYLDAGALMRVKHQVSRRISMSGLASWHDRQHRKAVNLDGSVLDFSLNGAWLAMPTVQVNAAAGYAVERADLETWRNDSQWGRLGFSVALPRGFALGGSGEYRWTDYDGNWFPYTDGSSRKDRTRIFRASVYNRGFTLYGFSPQLVVSNEERDTNAQLYDYKRTNGEIRFVRQF